MDRIKGADRGAWNMVRNTFNKAQKRAAKKVQ